MKGSILTSAVLLISVALVSGCSMNRADSLRMLDKRAEYEDAKALEALKLKEGGISGFEGSPIPVRTHAKVAAVWIHMHPLPSDDYFWGGWVSLVYEKPHWKLADPGELPQAPGVSDITGATPKKKKRVRSSPRSIAKP